MGDFGHNIQDCIVMDLAMIGHSNIHQILELLEVFMAGHVALSESIQAGFSLMESQREELLVLKLKSDGLNHGQQSDCILIQRSQQPLFLLLEF